MIQWTPVNCSTSPPTAGFLFVHILPLNNLMAQVLEIISKYGLTFASISYNKPKIDYFLPIASQFWFILSLIIVATIYWVLYSLHNLFIFPKITLKISYYY